MFLILYEIVKGITSKHTNTKRSDLKKKFTRTECFTSTNIFFLSDLKKQSKIPIKVKH